MFLDLCCSITKWAKWYDFKALVTNLLSALSYMLISFICNIVRSHLFGKASLMTSGSTSSPQERHFSWGQTQPRPAWPGSRPLWRHAASRFSMKVVAWIPMTCSSQLKDSGVECVLRGWVKLSSEIVRRSSKQSSLSILHRWGLDMRITWPFLGLILSRWRYSGSHLIYGCDLGLLLFSWSCNQCLLQV